MSKDFEGLHFRDRELAGATIAHLENLAEAPLDNFLTVALERAPDPDLALINLSRWLSATSNPRTNLEHLIELPLFAQMLVRVLSSSQAMADALIQNPELASIVTQPSDLAVPCTRQRVVAEGRQLLKSSSSYAHGLDRLRYLKQRWRVPIAVNDLAGSWAPQDIWRAISDLADAIIELALDACWNEYSTSKGCAMPCPVGVIGFGKLGGQELNYSSDIDLVYVLQDDADEALERHGTRFCEMLNGALATPMGRGSLYRVDLRLRPYGGAGPILQRMRSVEAYYRSHAEYWGFQALLRSRVIVENDDLEPRWDAMRDQYCFRKATSEMAVSSMVDSRERIEERADPGDFKNGPGGIRDVEFIVQLLQIIHGSENEKLRARMTLDALNALREQGYVPEAISGTLAEGYIFLRQLEHRCQLVDDQQTHSVPSSERGRMLLAAMMGSGAYKDLESRLTSERQQVRQSYTALLNQLSGTESYRSKVAERVGMEASAAVTNWFDHLSEPEDFYRCLFENTLSLGRVVRIAQDAPALLPGLSENLAVTEAIISGEIEENEPIEQLDEFTSPKDSARQVLMQWRRILSKWTIQPDFELGPSLSALADALLSQLRRANGAKFDIVALGSYGTQDLSITSDIDLVLLLQDEGDHATAEADAQKLIASMSEMRQFGMPLGVDLRLRPEGRQGLLVRTYSGLKAYELERMEMWERFALGHARLVEGNPEGLAVVLGAAYALPLTPGRLKELLAMKHRVETELVLPQHWKRNVKIGFGGLSDIEWFVHVHEMRYPTTLQVGPSLLMRERLRRIAQAGLINAWEYETLLGARLHLLETRNRLVLLGFEPDVVPENPDKLEKLARSSGFTDGYAFQEKHKEVIEAVRSIYEGGVERLGS